MSQLFGISITELVGYLATGVVLVSFLMKQMKMLRIISIIGCGLFVIYGVLLTSYPIIVTNVAIIIINGYFIVKNKQNIK